MSFCISEACRGGHPRTDETLCIGVRRETLAKLLEVAEWYTEEYSGGKAVSAAIEDARELLR